MREDPIRPEETNRLDHSGAGPAERIAMEQAHREDAECTSQSPPGELDRFILRLRRIGLEEEARRLELALRELAPEETE